MCNVSSYSATRTRRHQRGRHSELTTNDRCWMPPPHRSNRALLSGAPLALAGRAKARYEADKDAAAASQKASCVPSATAARRCPSTGDCYATVLQGFPCRRGIAYRGNGCRQLSPPPYWLSKLRRRNLAPRSAKRCTTSAKSASPIDDQLSLLNAATTSLFRQLSWQPEPRDDTDD
jgi:hypothetical protein